MNNASKEKSSTEEKSSSKEEVGAAKKPTLRISTSAFSLLSLFTQRQT
jgi:hypothetical protein